MFKHKLTTDGIQHLVLPLVAVVLLVAAGGTYFMVKGHAASNCGPSNAAWTTSSKTGSYYPSGNYAYHNNEWGAGANQQTMWVVNPGSWGVCANQPFNSGNVKSYPEAQRTDGQTIGSLSTAYVDVNYKVPSAGTYDAAVDDWIDGAAGTSGAKEVMFWTYTRGANPAGSKIATYNFGGDNWNVYKSGNTYTFQRQDNDASTRVYMRAGFDWLVSHGYLKNSDTFTQFNWGYEIVGTAGGVQDFTTTGLSWDVQ